MGDRAATKILQFFALHGLHLSQAHLMATAAPVQGGRYVKVLTNLRRLADIESEKERAAREEYTITSDPGCFFLEASGLLVGGLINEGDLLKIEPQSPIAAGNFVLTEIQGELEVRRVAFLVIPGGDYQGIQQIMILESLAGRPVANSYEGQTMFRITGLQKNI